MLDDDGRLEIRGDLLEAWANPDSTRPGPALLIPHGVASRLGEEATAKKQRK
jgi:hypothetical protein